MQSINKKGLLHQVLDFNFRPLSYMHPSWLSRLSPGVTDAIRMVKSPERNPDIAAEINQELELDGDYYFEFGPPVTKLALRTRMDLKRVLFLSGFGLMQHELKKIVSKADVQQLNARVSAQDLEFAYKRASRYTRGIDLEMLRFSSTTLPVDMRAKLLGEKCLWLIFEDMPDAFKRRLELKFPVSRADHHKGQYFGLTKETAESYLLNIAAHHDTNEEV